MSRTFLTNIDLKGNQLYNVILHNAASNSGLSTTNGSFYYDTTAAAFQFRQAGAWIGFIPSSYTLSDINAPGANVALNNKKITGLADPTDAQDAATKAYVDATAQGLDVKGSVRAATTVAGGNISLISTQTIDGVSLSVGDRVLVKNQTTGSENGIWVVGAGNWNRATDAAAGKLTAGAFVFVEEGTVNADSGWVLTNNGTITVGTTALTFDQFSGAGQITAGTGLTKSGNTINFVGVTNGGLTVNADSVQVNASELFIGTSNVVVGASGGSQALTGITTINSTTIPTSKTLVVTTDKLSALAATSSSELAGVISDETGSGALVFGTGPTISLPSINNIKLGYTTTVTSGTTQTMDVNANAIRFYTGSTAQTVTLPVASTLALGMSYEFHNNSTAVLTIQSSGSNTVVTVPPATTVRVTCILTSGTTASSWDYDFTGQNNTPIRKVASTVSLTAATEASITHSLNTRDVVVQMWETSSSLPTNVVEMDVVNFDANTVKVTASITGTYYYVIMG